MILRKSYWRVHISNNFLEIFCGFSFNLLHGFYRKVFQLSQRNFGPPDSFCTTSSWSTENGSYYSEPQPSDPLPLLGSHKRCILLWTAHSNLLRSKVGRPQDRKESWRKFYRNRHRQNTQDGSSCPWLSNSSVISFLSKFRQRYLRWTSSLLVLF